MKEESIVKEESLVLPITFLVAYLVALILLRIYLPPAKEILSFIESFYSQFGYWIISVSGLLEALFLVGSYIPGSSAILLGAALSKNGVVFLPFVILLGTLSLTLGYTINYFLGKYGWYRALEKFGLKEGIHAAEKKLTKHRGKTLAFGYISPSIGSFVSTASGIAGIPFKTFIFTTLIAQLFWSTVWGTVAYLVGPIFVEYFLKYGVMVFYVIIGIMIIKQLIKSGFFRFL